MVVGNVTQHHIAPRRAFVKLAAVFCCGKNKDTVIYCLCVIRYAATVCVIVSV